MGGGPGLVEVRRRREGTTAPAAAAAEVQAVAVTLEACLLRAMYSVSVQHGQRLHIGQHVGAEQQPSQ